MKGLFTKAGKGTGIPTRERKALGLAGQQRAFTPAPMTLPGWGQRERTAEATATAANCAGAPES